MTPHSACNYCEKRNHTEHDCWVKGRKCLVCGSTEHQVNSCPKKGQGGVSGQSSNQNTHRSANEGSRPRTPSNEGGSRSRVVARVYAIDRQQTPETTKVVEGTPPVFHRLARTLIDPGATHSFVNPEFICGIDLIPIKLSYDLKVKTPMGEHTLITNMVYRGCEFGQEKENWGQI